MVRCLPKTLALNSWLISRGKLDGFDIITRLFRRGRMSLTDLELFPIEC